MFSGFCQQSFGIGRVWPWWYIYILHVHLTANLIPTLLPNFRDIKWHVPNILIISIDSFIVCCIGEYLWVCLISRGGFRAGPGFLSPPITANSQCKNHGVTYQPLTLFQAKYYDSHHSIRGHAVRNADLAFLEDRDSRSRQKSPESVILLMEGIQLPSWCLENMQFFHRILCVQKRMVQDFFHQQYDPQQEWMFYILFTIGHTIYTSKFRDLPSVKQNLSFVLAFLYPTNLF